MEERRERRKQKEKKREEEREPHASKHSSQRIQSLCLHLRVTSKLDSEGHRATKLCHFYVTCAISFCGSWPPSHRLKKQLSHCSCSDSLTMSDFILIQSCIATLLAGWASR